MMMTGAPMTSKSPAGPPPELEQLDKTIASLNQWLETIPAVDVELKLKVTDRLLKAYDMRRKMAGPKGKGGKFGKMAGAQ